MAELETEIETETETETVTEKVTEKKKKHLVDQFIVLPILTYVLILLSGVPQYFVAALLAPLSVKIPDLTSLVHYFSTLGYWVVFLLFMAIYKPDRPLIRSLFTGKTNTWKFFLIGLGVGLVTNGSCILVSVLHQDISLYFDPSSVPLLILCFLAVIIQSGSEELICRHFMQQHLRRRYQKPWLEILLPGFFFAALHLFNPGISVIAVINLVVCGILLGASVYYFDSMWFVIGFHTMWNYTQNVIFGLPNSGIVLPLSIFRLDAASGRDSFSYNAAFGVEGSLMALLVQAVALFFVIFLGKKKKSPNR